MSAHDQYLHIVAFNIPYPPNYGGVIDIFYKLKALHQTGVKIHLHCFSYGRNPSPELQKYCEKVFYYKRKTGIAQWFSITPYIVKSRQVKQLLHNLGRLKAPILFEGEHCAGFINKQELKNHIKWIRIHNIEYRYYNDLGTLSKNPFQKLYYLSEALKLRHFNKHINYADGLAVISAMEAEHLDKVHPNCHWVPAFHQDLEFKERNFEHRSFLFHGDLSIESNKRIAIALAEIFKDRTEELHIAGKIDPDRSQHLSGQYTWVRFHFNIPEKEMRQLLYSHPYHLIYSEHSQGVKLKLIHSLLSGAIVIANEKAVTGSGFSHLIRTYDIESLSGNIDKLGGPTIKEMEKLKSLLDRYYNNRKNAERLLKNIIGNDLTG